YHTIGQRQGLGIGGLKNASEEPWYVLEKDLARNVLIVGQGEHPWLFSRALTTSQIYWVNPVELSAPRRLAAKVRYRQQDQACTLAGPAAGYRVVFAERPRAVAPGRAVVFSGGEVCLGGGVIEQAGPWYARNGAAA